MGIWTYHNHDRHKARSCRFTCFGHVAEQAADYASHDGCCYDKKKTGKKKDVAVEALGNKRLEVANRNWRRAR